MHPEWMHGNMMPVDMHICSAGLAGVWHLQHAMQLQQQYPWLQSSKVVLAGRRTSSESLTADSTTRLTVLHNLHDSLWCSPCQETCNTVADDRGPVYYL